MSCTYTASHGITPGIATLELPDQDVRGIAGFGDLTITDGSGTLVLRKCRVTAVDYSQDGGPRRVILHIADRRWQWRYGYITGFWNQSDPYPDPELFPPGEFVAVGSPFAPGTYRPCHKLMADCFKAMNEFDPLIDPAPDVAIPAAWDEEVPAAALQQLCDAVGFVVAFRPSLNTTLVTLRGVGRGLPDDLPYTSGSPSLAAVPRPATIQLVGGETLFNDYLKLEPCGLEPTGEVRHIDDLSYKPANGWATCHTQSFWEARPTKELTHEEAMELAKRHVWRTFRVAMRDVVTGLNGPNVPGYGRVRDRKQIVLQPCLYRQFKRADGQPDTTPAYVVGSIYITKGEWRMAGNADTVMGNTDPGSGQRLPRVPQIDTGRGLVHFDRQCYKEAGVAPNRTRAAPELYLATAFYIRGVVGRMPTKFVRGGTLPGLADQNCPPEVLRHPELQLIWNIVRKSADRTVVLQDNNLDQLVPAADYYLRRAAEKYEVTGSLTRTYAGIHPIDPDGAISQVTWRVGGGQPATTTASLNTEHDRYVPPFPERRRNEQIQAFAGKAIAQDRDQQRPHKRTDVNDLPPPPAGS